MIVWIERESWVISKDEGQGEWGQRFGAVVLGPLCWFGCSSVTVVGVLVRDFREMGVWTDSTVG
jgi:hypothetical protein